MANIIIIIILIGCVGWACYYIYSNRKKGVKCIGCPYAKSCSGGCGSDHKNDSERRTEK